MEVLQAFINFLSSPQLVQFSTTTGTSFALIVAAEIGDKSQLVCMSLASRYRGLPIILGAVAAFVLLNTLAVIFGAAIANWLPEYIVAAVVALLFTVFGVHALFIHDENEEDAVVEKTGHSLFFTTFLLITVAEFGDKTQLAVVAFSSTVNPYAVWLGSSLALTFTSTLGVLAGRTVLQKIPLSLLHKSSGVFFLILAVFAGYKSYILFTATIVNL